MNRFSHFVWFLSVAWLFAMQSFADEVQFNRDIRPLFSDTCFKCHGPDSNTREAGLRLDRRDDAVDFGAFVAGDADASEIIARIESEDADLRMPPPESGLSLSSDDRATMRQWVAEGAVYEEHWSFQTIVKPDPPSPFAHLAPIDAFVFRRLDQANLKPLGPANPATQLRRVSLDLAGLPPTTEESKQFQKDLDTKGLEVAYEHAVDRLLQSPRFGEHMAWQWLEASRYADTDGYQNDGPREMWRWRDWVIDAYNDNMPFDQFTIEQLAGDLLPNPTESNLIATAFNRNNRYNSEEGIPIDEFLLENAVDRVDTTSTVWMGMTFGCARCHDHKYDPISQREYYQLIDFFNDVEESGRAIKMGNSEPWIRTPTDSQRKKLAEWDQKVLQAMVRLKKAEPRISKAQREWEATADWGSISPSIRDGLDHHFTFDAADDRLVSKQGEITLEESPIGQALTLSGEDQIVIGKIPGLIATGRTSLAFWMQPNQVDSGVVMSNEELKTTRAGSFVEFVDGRLRWNLNNRWISGVATIECEPKFEPGVWKHIVLTNDGTQSARGMKIYVDGQLQPANIVRNAYSNDAKRDKGVEMSLGYSKHDGFWKGRIDDLRYYTRRTLSVDEAQVLALKQPLDGIPAIPPAKRNVTEARKLRTAYLENTDNQVHRKLLSDLRDAKAKRQAYADQLPTTMIMRDLPEGRPSFVRKRGVYDQLGEPAPAGIPAVLPSLPQSDERPASRLAFARWLVDGKHPLTARVVVNRYWQMLFGRGLVNTPEDFGSQGDLPTHPDLLDWLASDFMENGWDVKATLKTIVLSEAYRRSSRVTKHHRTKDPGNQWYARANRRRLSGNILRDQALQVSGMLVKKLGGPSVKPYQPKGLWKEASNFTYKDGKGEDLYRRSLYTYWKRTLSPPNMALLDTADREWCSVKPRQTNTPLQALTLLNDVTFAEAARKLGELMLDSGATDKERIDFAFVRLLNRHPSDSELAVLTDAMQTYRASFAASPDLAREILSIGQSKSITELPEVDRAAATALANILLNLEEATTRD